jgi:hypothetical protein
MRSLKIRAAQSDRRLKDVVTEFLQRDWQSPTPAPHSKLRRRPCVPG